MRKQARGDSYNKAKKEGKSTMPASEATGDSSERVQKIASSFYQLGEKVATGMPPSIRTPIAGAKDDDQGDVFWFDQTGESGQQALRRWATALAGAGMGYQGLGMLANRWGQDAPPSVGKMVGNLF